ncbi:hypothetical protein [Streptomyces sp. ISL-86]|uniref:hypothetical protein n=1 Tax=Streptomyces sp. ISL-86 TaxID=2819187 RepID=UPI001BEBFE4E|nr:hypothetical protein [Streptomyces sp. ISL-86]MBT2459998.1 hypothetical protein [Streptomyces sp. ISL-86]
MSDTYHPKWFPDFTEYAWHLPCPQCHAEPRQPCHAPYKQAHHDRVNRLLTNAGHAPDTPPQYGFMHKRRSEAGSRHRSGDIGAAPWAEERVPGTRYDTIDRGDTPPTRTRGERAVLLLDQDAVDQRGRALFGADREERTAAWPYGLEQGQVRNRQTFAELAALLEHLAVGRSTIVSWADHYGLKVAQRNPCCARWLTRSSYGACPKDRWTGRPDCWNGDLYTRGWRDHPIAWVLDGRPAAITAAPGLRHQDFAATLDTLTGQDERLAWTAGGKGWYGYRTSQVVIWRRDLLGDVDTADSIRAAVQAALAAEAATG